MLRTASILLLALLPLAAQVVIRSSGVTLESELRETIRVLIIDGQNNHGWAATTKALKATLEATGRFTVTVSTSPGKKGTKEAWAAWRPTFKDHQVVVGNYNGQPWPEPVNKAYLAFIEGGGGAVNVHAANNSFAGWKEWNRLIALGWRGPKFGDRVTVNDKTGAQLRTAKGKGPGAGHGRQHSFLVTVRAKAHPIMKGLPTWWKHAKDELYHGQRGPGENMQILSSAWSDPKSGGTGEHEPITWVVPHGKGNVVTTVLGHHWGGQKDFEALHCVGFQTVLARACEWAGTGTVTIPVPKGFPTDKATSITTPSEIRWRAR
ncbi:MAG: ThuA domain-containing protein [Planctomycetota bacterium]|nr:ThuA domain-containing protein [Planctomycetota bacterium]